jgi:tRNA 2-selenouridine synthase
MLLYYDPLYRHTCPEQRITVTIADAEPDLSALKTAIARILKHPPGDPAGAEETLA